MTARTDINRLGWDTSEFPILCENCLGPTPYIRMIQAIYDSECKICKRPFTIFSWKPDKHSRYKKTEICKTCAKLKNVCQTCLLDLQFNLPVEVRDKYLKQTINIPKETSNRDFFIANCTKNIDKLDLPYYKEGAYKDNFSLEINEIQHNTNNSTQICTFYLKGVCSKGEQCPYKHEIPSIEDIINNTNDIDKVKNIIEDPIEKKILREYSDSKPPLPPEDKSITTLYINGIIDNSVKEKDLVQIFSKFGQIKGVKLMLKTYCAFVTFVNREDAEQCVNELYNNLVINLEKYRLTWAKVNDPEFIGEKKKNNKTNEHEEEIEYVTECPLYNGNGKKKVKENQFVKKEIEKDGKCVYKVDLTCYDKGERPFYASIQKNVKGGLLQRKRKLIGDI